MPLVTDRAIVLQAFAYSDTSKILRLFCRDSGVRSVIAKGAQRPKSRYGGLLEPFTEGDASFYLREGRDLHTLSGFDLVRSRQALGRNLGAFTGASLVAELVLRSGTEEPHPELFASVVAALDRLADAPAEEAPALALAAVWEVVARLGFRPELDACVHCGRVMEAEEECRFDVQAGGATCLRCRPSGRVVAPGPRAELRRMLDGTPQRGPLGDAALHRALLRVFLGAHVLQHHPLRSLEMFLAELEP